MGKRLLRVVSIVLALAALPSALLSFAFFLPPQYGDTFLGELSWKTRALEEAPGRRIILVGGSAAAFGLRCDLLEQELPGFTVRNMGMYAGLGSTVTLNLTLEQVRAGDIVLFLPEQSAQTLSLYLNPQAMWQAADGDWPLLRALRPQDWGAMVGQLPLFAGEKARCVWTGERPKGEGVYARSSFNAWGDIAYTERTSNIMPGGWDGNMPISFDPQLLTEDFAAAINAAAGDCASKGASFYYRFCPMNAEAIAPKERERLSAYAQSLAARLDCPVLGQAEEAVMEAGWFYDTNFHLNSAGAVAYTAALAIDLKAMLGIAGDSTIAVPDCPALEEGTAFTGDDSDAAYFVYEETPEGLRVMGLTETGTRRERLILPTHWEGRPVVSFSSTVFAGNPQVQEIVVQGNIRNIEDGSFAGCTALAGLVLRQSAPSRCTVGAGLLEGTTAQVIVPQGQVGEYKTNYFWSVHASRIQGDGTAPSGATAAPTERPPSHGEGLLRYDANGGRALEGDALTLEIPVDANQLRTNTLQGTQVFIREGAVLTGWNTAPDGSGIAVGLGSRIAPAEGLILYAQWLPEAPETDFDWIVEQSQAWITSWHGTGETCVLPATLGGYPVRRVCAGAFRASGITRLVLPPTLYTIEKEAFAGCAALREITLFDSLLYVYDESFADCTALTTLRINAAVSPVYSASYYAAFADKFDRLLSLSGQRKLVLFSGSSTRYAYDSGRLHAAYPAFQPVNMGVYAYTNALPQMELIRGLMEPGDVLLHAPEFDTLRNQLCYQTDLDTHFFAMMEADYDTLSRLDLRTYTHVFDSLREYLLLRRDMPKLSYTVSPNHYDDDGNASLLGTYNAYGDYILFREGAKQDALLQHMRASYTPAPFSQDRLEALNRVYARFHNKGVQVLFTYTPRNSSSLTEDSTPENRAALDALLRETLCVPIISALEDSLYPGTYFYLIDSHLSSEGAQVFTTRIIRDLAPYLGADAPHSLVVPPGA